METRSKSAIVLISGFSSDVGKTTLLCELLRQFSGWEAIKITRGHYRSCGKNPHACCVSGMLGERPTVHSGCNDTFSPGKDTAKYWEAGAANVHWVICTDDQVEEGVQIALDRVRSPGVFVEGNSFLKHFEADFSIMVARPPIGDIKSSAVRIMRKMNGLFVSVDEWEPAIAENLRDKLARRGVIPRDVPTYTRRDFPALVTDLNRCLDLAQNLNR